MTVLSVNDQRENATSNVIWFPRAYARRVEHDTAHLYSSGSHDARTQEMSRENLLRHLAAAHRELSARINAIACARATVVRLENEMKLRKALGDKNALP